MIHLFKKGGPWKTKDGQEYTVKCVNYDQVNKMLDDGWRKSLPDAFAIEVKAESAEYSPAETSDREAYVRQRIVELGGKAGGRAKLETLEKKLAELEDDQKD